MKKIKFEASLPPTANAITLDGQGDGGRIKMDISRQYVNALLELQKEYAGKSFSVVVGGEE